MDGIEMDNASQFSASQRASEKEEARRADAWALENGLISEEELRAQNEPIRALVGPQSQIRLSAAQSLY
jgi:hypothetical protein